MLLFKQGLSNMHINSISGCNFKNMFNNCSSKMSFGGYDDEDDDDGVNWSNGWGPLSSSELSAGLCSSWQAKRINEKAKVNEVDDSDIGMDIFIPQNTKIMMD